MPSDFQGITTPTDFFRRRLFRPNEAASRQINVLK
jgi:hypothetical protein